ncbi:hypothetical protein COCNU_contig69216702G000010 [Cocos nucifera]|nr:hypothetical protein [Cocos nucifera]
MGIDVLKNSYFLIHWNCENVVLNKYSAMIWLAFSVGWTASQNTYLLASGHVNGLNSLHVYPTSIVPVAQHPNRTFSNPPGEKGKKKKKS